jgi:hypothetical protein
MGSLPTASQVNDLKAAAQESFSVSLYSLVSATGQVLEGTVEDAALKDGDTVTAVVQPPRIFSGRSAGSFALVRSDMTVVTWGSHGSGDLSFDVKRQLHNVKEIQASDSAFAALCGDGRVVAWGMPDAGGDCRKVEDELCNVRQVVASKRAFAAIRTDGTVVAWGDPDSADISKVHLQLRDIEQITASDSAFAAKKRMGESSRGAKDLAVVIAVEWKRS